MNPYLNLSNTWDVCPCGRPPPESPSESTDGPPCWDWWCWDWWGCGINPIFGASGTINPSYHNFSSVLWFGFWMEPSIDHFYPSYHFFHLSDIISMIWILNAVWMLWKLSWHVMTCHDSSPICSIRDHQGPLKNGVQSPATGNSVSQWLRFPGHRELIIENL